MGYYNEIQRLNTIISDQNSQLLNLKSANENLNEQYDNILKDFQLEQKMVEDLNQQTFELNRTLQNTTSTFMQQSSEKESNDTEAQNDNDQNTPEESTKAKELENKYKQLVEQLEQKIDNLVQEKSFLIEENSRNMEELNTKMNQSQMYYENLIKQENENFRGILANEEQQRAKMSRELARLKEHLVEMSESYNKDAIQAEEREKQLRLALNDAQNNLQQQGASLENSRFDL